MPSVGDIAQVRLFYFMAGQYFECAFGFQCLSGTATLQDLADDFKAAVVKNTSGGFFYGLDDACGSTQLRVEDVKPGTAASVDLSYAAVAGDVGSVDPLPPQCAAVISWRTALAGRSYHGRSYIAGLPETRQSAGTIDATGLSNLTAFVNQMIAVFGVGGTNTDWQFGVISRIAGGVPRAAPIITDVTAGIPRATVYTQRRRTLGVGQ